MLYVVMKYYYQGAARICATEAGQRQGGSDYLQSGILISLLANI